MIMKHGAPSRFAAILFARPRLLLRALAVLILVCSLGVVFTALNIPLTSARISAGADGAIMLANGSRTIHLPPGSQLRFSSAHGETVLPADLMPNTADPRGTRAEIAAYRHGRDRLAALLAAGPVKLETQGHRLTVASRERSLVSLPAAFWMPLIVGAAAALAGIWIWILRPLGWAPAMFALGGGGLFLGCATIALGSVGGIAMSGFIQHAVQVINFIGGIACAGGFVALFARFPVALIPPRPLLWLGLPHLVLVPAIMFDLPYAADLGILLILADSHAIILLVCLQAWLTRRDPARRAALLPIAAGTVVSVVLFVLLSMAGQLNGGVPMVDPGLTAPLFLLIYFGLGISVVRMRLFALGSWALNLLVSACAILLFVLLDALMLTALASSRDEALLISAFLSITAYLPAREWLLRRAERLRDHQAGAMLRHAADIAMALTPADAASAWRAAIATMFDALETQETPYAGEAPVLLEAGAALYLPVPLAREAVLLRMPQGGTRIFGPEDLAAARDFGELVRSLAESRDAYVRGVAEERARIARDLHDDVSARLLTSLHRRDPALMQEDVRDAMADIRSIVAGLDGAERRVDETIADLRHETVNRLDAANLALDWPFPELSETSPLLDHGRHRAIVSIVRECITNIIRHAGAAHVRVAIDTGDDALRIAMSDDGRGLPPGRAGGKGLANARRRAAELGGHFEIDRADGWTTARLAIPLPGKGDGMTGDLALEEGE